MPELERYMVHLLSVLDERLQGAVRDYDFNEYVRRLSEFANEDLSIFYFDIRKDTLYCEVNAGTGQQTTKRRAYRTVLDALFKALARYAAPVLVFTSEEVWGTRYPEAGSVHLLEWPELPPIPGNSKAFVDAIESIGPLKQWRGDINRELEVLRRQKSIGASLEAVIDIYRPGGMPPRFNGIDLAEVFIVSEVFWHDASPPTGAYPFMRYDGASFEGIGFTVRVTTNHKCGRCWRHLPEVVEDGDLCKRCEEVVHAS